jgi:hypothetical protein
MPHRLARRRFGWLTLVLLGASSGLLALARGRAEPIGTPACPPGEPIAVLSQAAPPPAPAAPAAGADDYRHLLRPTSYGWPRRHHWCVWIEPIAGEGPGARWDQAWLGAVEAALLSWSELVAISRVDHPAQAQVLIRRRRPPLRAGRASHGRAELELVRMRRAGLEELEPRVTVRLSPAQRAEAIQATALHELGHAFGLWGHSDRSDDAMAAVPGARPILALTARDRATFAWLQRQPGLQAPLRPEPPGPAERSPAVPPGR